MGHQMIQNSGDFPLTDLEIYWKQIFQIYEEAFDFQEEIDKQIMDDLRAALEAIEKTKLQETEYKLTINGE